MVQRFGASLGPQTPPCVAGRFAEQPDAEKDGEKGGCPLGGRRHRPAARLSTPLSRRHIKLMAEEEEEEEEGGGGGGAVGWWSGW